MKMTPMALISIVVTMVFAVAGQLLVKKGMLAVGAPLPTLQGAVRTALGALLNPYVIMGLGSSFVAALGWLLALSKLPLSYAYPFMALTFVLIPVCSLVFFNESVPPTRWFGIVFIVFGVWLSYR